MKKFTTIALALFVCFASVAQRPLELQQAKLPKVVSAIKNLSMPVPKPIGGEKVTSAGVTPARHSNYPMLVKASPSETIIGHSYYDLQTNSGICNRFLNHANGTMSATWTFSPDPDAASSHPNRGTGYNFYNGTTWGAIPAARIETDRAGWPNIMSTSSGKEAVITHSSGFAGMLITHRPTTGSGIWLDDPNIIGGFVDDTWNKSASGGATGTSIHSIWNGSGVSGNSYHQQIGPVYYNRSTNEGVTWDISRSIIPGLDSSLSTGYGGDDYSIDSRNDIVAIAAGGFGKDVTLMKSTDNGTTWTRTVVDQFPIPVFDANIMLSDTNSDGVADQVLCGAGDNHVLIDNNGMCHVWFSVVTILNDNPGSGLSYFPLSSEGLYYWNETMAPNTPQLIAFAQDLDASGAIELPTPDVLNCNNQATNAFPFGTYRGGFTQMPSAGVDVNNNLYLAYQSVDESSDTSLYQRLFKHVFLMASTDNGATWTAPVDIVKQTQGALASQMEGVFASMAKRVDSKVHIIYQRDGAPGHGVYASAATGGCDYVNNNAQESDIIYYEIPTNEVVGINHVQNTSASVSVYPNPAKDEFTLSFPAFEKGNTMVTLTDVLGKTVRDFGSALSGNVRYSVRGLDAGVYFINVKTSKDVVTQRLQIIK